RALQAGDDRRRALDGALERVVDSSAPVDGRGQMVWGPSAEHHQRRAPPGRLDLPHHELIGARARPPVHAAWVVAGLVGADGEELAGRVGGCRAWAAVV